MSLKNLNSLPTPDARKLLHQCCTSEAWVDGLLAKRPFANAQSLRSEANIIWAVLEEVDYLQAFEGHPKIGDVNSLKEKYAATKALAAGEQSSVNEANESVIAALAEKNQSYQDKFGFIFIVCATGKSAEKMLGLLEQRLPNERSQELGNACEEQRKIFQLRLEKLL